MSEIVEPNPLIKSIVTICTNKAQLLLDVPEIADPESKTRNNLENWSGGKSIHSADGTKVMKLLSSLDGLESLELLPYIIVTSFEEIFGYRELTGYDEAVQIPNPVPMVWEWKFTKAPGNQKDIDGSDLMLSSRELVPMKKWKKNIVEIPDPQPDKPDNKRKVDQGAFEDVDPGTRPTPIYQIHAGDPVLLALYKEIYPYDVPVPVENGPDMIRSQFFATFGEDQVAHILEES